MTPSVTKILTPVPLSEVSFTFASGTDKPGAVFGGQLLGQALMSAGSTVPSAMSPRSLQGHFLRPADSGGQLRFDVDVSDDGRRSALRHVRVTQADKHVAEFTVSFGISGAVEPALVDHGRADEPEDWLTAAPDDDIVRQVRAWRDTVQGFLGLDLAFAEEPARAQVLRHGRAPGHQQFRVRCHDALPDSALMRCAAVAYMSDLLLLSTALGPRGFLMADPSVRAVSKDHTLWFHTPYPDDSWLCYRTAEMYSGTETSLCHGALTTMTELPVATSMQEGVIRTAPLT